MDGGKRRTRIPHQSSDWWTTTEETPWQPEEPVGGFEVNSLDSSSKYIKHDQWGQEWLMLNYDSGAAVTALPVAVAGDLPLEKRGELRVASGAIIPNLGKIKMMSTDESGVARSLRGHITEVSKPLLSAAEVSKKWDFLLFEDGRNSLGTKLTCGVGSESNVEQTQMSGIAVARASDSTAKETCITRMCELAM